MKVNTYLNFPGNCLEAMKFYEKHLGAKILMKSTFAEMSASGAPEHLPPGLNRDGILHARFTLGDTIVMASDGPKVEPMRSAYLTLAVDSNEEAERIYAALTEGGEVFMKMGEHFSRIALASSATSLASTGWSFTKSRCSGRTEGRSGLALKRRPWAATLICPGEAPRRAGTTMAFKFQGFDFLGLDASLTEEELLVRRTARDFVDAECDSDHRRLLSRGAFSARACSADGRAGLLRREPRRLRLRRHVECRVRPGDAGAGARRLGLAQLCQRAIGAGDVSHLHLRIRRTKEHMAAGAGHGRKAWLLRADRAGIRIESGGHDHARAQIGRRVHPERREDVDHVGIDRRCGRDLGEARGRGR